MGNDVVDQDLRGRKPEEALARQNRRIPQRVGELHRNTRGLPEVVIKVSSYTKDRARAGAHADYITRREKEGGDLAAEMSDGSLLLSSEDVDAVLDGWFARKEVRRDARRTVNIVLSSPKGSDPEKVRVAARRFGSDFFGNHEHMFVIHTDTENPHAHMSVKIRGLDGKKLRLGKSELRTMRERYAEALRGQGIEVNASYRTDRAQWRRGRSQALHHLDKPNLTKPRESRLSRSLKDQAKRRSHSTDEPWRSAMTKRYRAVKLEYLGAARFLRKQFGTAFEKQASDLENFGQTLSFPNTLSDAVKTSQNISETEQASRSQPKEPQTR